MSSLILSLMVKATIIVALGLGLTAILRRAPAAFRHLVLLGTLMSALALPLLMVVAPRWNVPMLQAGAAETPANMRVRQDIGKTTPASGLAVVTTPPEGTDVGGGAAASRPFSSAEAGWETLLVIAWLLGSLAVLGWLALGRLRLRKLMKRSWPLDGVDWVETLRVEKQRSSVGSSVRLLCHPDVSTPLTWGSLNPVIMLPEDALEWSAEHRRIVVRHELAHVSRKDALAQLAAGVACSIYWFHPLVWIAERKLRGECERACDDRVVASGISAPVYAAHLLEVARSARSFGGPGFLSVAMARPSQLEGRLLAVLNESRSRNAVSPYTRWLLVFSMMVIAFAVSAFRAVPRVAKPDQSSVAGALENAGFRRFESTPVELPAVVTEGQVAARPMPATEESDSTFERAADAQSGGILTLDLKRTGGSVTVTGWNRAQVHVRARLGGRDWRETEVTLEPVAEGVVLRDVYTGSSSRTSFSNALDLRVPRNFSIRLNSAGGGISISGVNGRFTGMTGGGEIRIDRASGEVDLQTGGGDINVTNSSLRGVVSTGGGTVNIDGGGKELVGSSGSGEITSGTRMIRDLNTRLGELLQESGPDAGRVATIHSKSGSATAFFNYNYADSVQRFGSRGIQRRQAGGDITLAEAPNGARVTTGGGSIRIGPSGGEVYASTGGGSIEIGPASGSVIASTGAGNITLAFRGSGLHTADLTSGLGRVELVLPADINAELVLETAYTDNLGRKTQIESDWPLTITETNRWDASIGTPRKYVRARHTFGTGGGVIRVRTINGNVIVRKAAPA